MNTRLFNLLAAMVCFFTFTSGINAQSAEESIIKVLHHFDSGQIQPYELKADSISFQTGVQNYHLHVLLKNVPDGFTVNMYSPKKNHLIQLIADQGLWISHDGENYTLVPFIAGSTNPLSIKIEKGGDVWVSTVLPYGRNQMDLLLDDVGKTPWVNTIILNKNHRMVPVFQFGNDDGKKPIYYIICGEDAWETSGHWTGDYMVRTLCKDKSLFKKITRNAVVRIIPAASIYSNIAGISSSFTSTDGKAVYGGASWVEVSPPDEMELIKDMVEKTISEKRLRFFLTIHSWGAEVKTHGMEVIKTAGNNSLSPERQLWAEATMKQLTQDVTSSSWIVADRGWKKGIAREYMLRVHNICTFRIEMTTYKANQDYCKQPAEQMLRNLAEIKNWSGVNGK